MDQILLENIDVYVNKTLRYCIGCLHTDNEIQLLNLDTYSWFFTKFLYNLYCAEELNEANICVWCAKKLCNTLKLIKNMKQAQHLLARFTEDICTSHKKPTEVLTEINNFKYQTKPQIKHLRDDNNFILYFGTPEDVTSEIKTEIELDSYERDIGDGFMPFDIQEETLLSEKEFISTHSSKQSNPLSTDVSVGDTERCELSSIKVRGKKTKTYNDGPKQKRKRKNVVWKEIDCYIKQEIITEAQHQRDMEMRSRDLAYICAPFTCTICILPFNFTETYQNHMKRHKLNDALMSRTRNVRYTCMECGMTRADRSSARRHYVEKHATERMVSCTMCTKIFAKESILKTHISRTHSHGEGTGGMFVCSECGKCLKYKQSLRNHMMTHAKEKSEKEIQQNYLECSHCAKRFKAKGLLVKHVKTHNNARDFYCDICKASFKSAPILAIHTQRKHSSPDTYKYECSYCQKRFLVRGELNYHVNGTHLKQGVPCIHCHKSFRNAFKMRKHVQIVHERRPEPRNRMCEYCGKGFTEENRLKRHLLVHTGERPFACSVCAASFNQKSSLKGHLERAHGNGNGKRNSERQLKNKKNTTQ